MEHIYKEINKIRAINQEILKRKITVSEIQSFFEEVQDYTFQENETGNELKDIFTKDLIEVGRNTANIYGEFSLAEDILYYALDISENVSIHTEIHELLLTIQKNEENPFNDIKNIVKLINEIEKFVSNYRRVSIRDVTKAEDSLNNIISETKLNQISDCVNYENKVYFVEKVLENVNGPEIRRILTDDFYKILFNKIKTLIPNEEKLLGRINESVYKIPFSTHGIINKVDKIKQRLFRKDRNKE